MPQKTYTEPPMAQLAWSERATFNGGCSVHCNCTVKISVMPELLLEVDAVSSELDFLLGDRLSEQTEFVARWSPMPVIPPVKNIISEETWHSEKFRLVYLSLGSSRHSSKSCERPSPLTVKQLAASFLTLLTALSILQIPPLPPFSTCRI